MSPMFLASFREYVCLFIYPHNIHLVKLLEVTVFTAIVSMRLESKLKPKTY